jgi:hypothetical protein
VRPRRTSPSPFQISVSKLADENRLPHVSTTDQNRRLHRGACRSAGSRRMSTDEATAVRMPAATPLAPPDHVAGVFNVSCKPVLPLRKSMRVTNEELLAEVEDVLRSMPPRATLRHPEPENFEWLGRVSAAIEAWDSSKNPALSFAMNNFHNQMAQPSQDGYRKIMTLLYQAQSDLRMKTVGPINSLMEQGKVFQYFDLMRRIIETSSTDLLFVDNYLDADFIATYVPHVRPGVAVRLLGSHKIAALRSAAAQFTQEHGLALEVRSTEDAHARHVIVDGRIAYASDASFKDGPKRALATITQVEGSLFVDLKKQCENLWEKGFLR